MTGSVGTHGGNSGVSNGATGRGGIKSLPVGDNPAAARVATPMLADLLERGRAGGYPADIKLIYSAAGDLFNQLPNVAKTVAAVSGVEFMVVHDHFITPTARYADIVLPATTFWERNDVHTPWAGAGHYVIFMRQAIPPVGECRNDFDICAELARRLGIDDYADRTEEQWLRELTRDTIDDFDTFRGGGLARLPVPDDAVAFAREIRDPARHPFTTPSGKIEIYSMAIATNPDPYGLGAIPPIPTWIPDEAEGRYPLRLVSPKSRARTHSIHDPRGARPGGAPRARRRRGHGKHASGCGRSARCRRRRAARAQPAPHLLLDDRLRLDRTLRGPTRIRPVAPRACRHHGAAGLRRPAAVPPHRRRGLLRRGAHRPGGARGAVRARAYRRRAEGGDLAAARGDRLAGRKLRRLPGQAVGVPGQPDLSALSGERRRVVVPRVWQSVVLGQALPGARTRRARARPALRLVDAAARQPRRAAADPRGPLQVSAARRMAGDAAQPRHPRRAGAQHR